MVNDVGQHDATGSRGGRDPVLIHAPLEGDAGPIARLVEDCGAAAVICKTPDDLETALGSDPPAPVRALILSHEGSGEDTGRILQRALAREPEWSNPPILFLLDPRTAIPPAFTMLADGCNGQMALGLSRPVPPPVFNSAMAAQLAVRRRQYEAKDLLRRVESAEARKQFLLDELRHRTRNTLSVLQSMFKITARSSPDTDTLIGDFSDRLSAIARAQNALASESERSQQLRSIVEAHVLPYAGEPDQLQLSGPDAPLSTRGTFDLSLIVHELATNAAKYGALSTGRGVVQVRWSRDATSGNIDIEWRESGGPPVAAPKRAGLGTALLQAPSLSSDNPPRAEFRPDGFVWKATLDATVVGSDPPAGPS